MDPAIIFNTNPLYCLEIFNLLVESLETEEATKYPFHYQDLEFKHNLFLNYVKRRNSLDRAIKIDNKIDKLMKFDKNELDKYLAAITDNYHKNIQKLQKNKDTDKIVIKNLKDTYETDLESTSILPKDIFEKHEKYCFSFSPMKAEEIKQIKKKISNKLGIKVQYTNVLLQGLKRGIGVYTKNLPDVYLRIVQQLAQKKELGIVISDDSLALGINMPFKSAVILGWRECNKFEDLIYQQMIGRAGRRGLDCEGNVIYANINWKVLMKSNIKKIIGHDSKIPVNYGVIKHISDIQSIDPIYKNSLRGVEHQCENDNDKYININNNDKKLLWKLRNYNDKIYPLLKKIYTLSEDKNSNNIVLSNNLAKNIIDTIFTPKEDQLVYSCFKNKSIPQECDDSTKFIVVEKIKELGEIFRIMYNIYITTSNVRLQEILSICFDTSKLIIFNYLELN